MSDEFEYVWGRLKKAFPILDKAYDEPMEINMNLEPDLFEQPLTESDPFQLIEMLRSMLVLKIEERMRKKVVPEFWSMFKLSGSPYLDFQQFYKAIEFLHSYFIKFQQIITTYNAYTTQMNHTSTSGNDKEMDLQLIFRSQLLSKLPEDYRPLIMIFYQLALKMHDAEYGEQNNECVVCTENNEFCSCKEIFKQTNQFLSQMSLTERLVGQVLTDTVYAYIALHVQKVCKDSFDVSFINSLQEWLRNCILDWVKNIYNSPQEECFLEGFDKTLINFLYHSYTKTRIDQLFNIIIGIRCRLTEQNDYVNRNFSYTLL